MAPIILTRHRLRHLPDLQVDPDILTARYDRSCSTANCTGQCCATGVWADAAERDAILRHADRIQAHMDPLQERNPDRWFDPEPWDHPDFPSGRAIGTASANGACVFLNADRRCVLQTASDAQTGRLKPFFCFAFPVTISESTLCLDEARDAACCTPVGDGPRTALELCAVELDYVLGAEGVAELRRRACGANT